MPHERSSTQTRCGHPLSAAAGRGEGAGGWGYRRIATPRSALDHFTAPRGEFTLVIAGAPGPEAADESEALHLLAAFKRAGARSADASAEVARRTGLPRRRLYDAWQTLEDG